MQHFQSDDVDRYLLWLEMIEEALPCFAARVWSNSEEAESCSSFIRPSPSPRANGQAKIERMDITQANKCIACIEGFPVSIMKLQVNINYLK